MLKTSTSFSFPHIFTFSTKPPSPDNSTPVPFHLLFSFSCIYSVNLLLPHCSPFPAPLLSLSLFLFSPQLPTHSPSRFFFLLFLFFFSLSYKYLRFFVTSSLLISSSSWSSSSIRFLHPHKPSSSSSFRAA